MTSRQGGDGDQVVGLSGVAQAEQKTEDES